MKNYIPHVCISLKIVASICELSERGSGDSSRYCYKKLTRHLYIYIFLPCTNIPLWFPYLCVSGLCLTFKLSIIKWYAIWVSGSLFGLCLHPMSHLKIVKLSVLNIASGRSVQEAAIRYWTGQLGRRADRLAGVSSTGFGSIQTSHSPQRDKNRWLLLIHPSHTAVQSHTESRS